MMNAEVKKENAREFYNFFSVLITSSPRRVFVARGTSHAPSSLPTPPRPIFPSSLQVRVYSSTVGPPRQRERERERERDMAGQLEIDAGDVVKIILQFFKENHLTQSYAALQSECQVRVYLPRRW